MTPEEVKRSDRKKRHGKNIIFTLSLNPKEQDELRARTAAAGAATRSAYLKYSAFDKEFKPQRF